MYVESLNLFVWCLYVVRFCDVLSLVGILVVVILKAHSTSLTKRAEPYLTAIFNLGVAKNKLTYVKRQVFIQYQTVLISPCFSLLSVPSHAVYWSTARPWRGPWGGACGPGHPGCSSTGSACPPSRSYGWSTCPPLAQTCQCGGKDGFIDPKNTKKIKSNLS